MEKKWTMAGIALVCVVVCLVAVVAVTPNSSAKPVMREIYTFPAPEDRVIASFGINETNPDRKVFFENPKLMDTFIVASGADIDPYYYPEGPVIGYGREGNGSVAVMIDETWEVNQSVVSTIYNRISARGKTFGLQNVPCKFIRMGFLKPDISRDTVPSSTQRAWARPAGV